MPNKGENAVRSTRSKRRNSEHLTLTYVMLIGLLAVVITFACNEAANRYQLPDWLGTAAGLAVFGVLLAVGRPNRTRKPRKKRR